MLPDADAAVENDSFDIPDAQTLMSRLQWEDSPDISPTDSASSKASKEIICIALKKELLMKYTIDRLLYVILPGTNHSDSRRPKKKKRASLGLNSGGGGGGGGVGGSLTGSSSSQSNISLSTKKKKPKVSAPSISSIYDDLN